ncbi:Conidiation protein 6-domain-containing protein [Flagelloscypha sp. PMI_526]|nr:Conidiation protein 6-domain-containing protein [Flagelloscypha sp. PMI_526]
MSKNLGNVAGGLKATLKNPNVSEEAKESAAERLDSGNFETEATELSRSRPDELKNEGNVIGGYKATLKNPRVSEEAKDHAEEVLRSKGIDVEKE